VRLLVITLAVMARRQSALYRDGETLYRETLARNPSCWMAHNNLGLALSAIPGRTPEAISHYEAACESIPTWPRAQINLDWHYQACRGDCRKPFPLRGRVAHQSDLPRDTISWAWRSRAFLGGCRRRSPTMNRAANRPNFAEAHHNLGVELREPGTAA